MNEKETKDLEDFLSNPNENFETFKKNFEIDDELEPFHVYASEVIARKRAKAKEEGKNYRFYNSNQIFIRANIKERYGYKLLERKDQLGNKRDIVFRIAYAAGFSVQEVNRALKCAGFSPLYIKDKRDAFLYYCFKTRINSFDVDDLDDKLIENGFAPLDTVGKDR